MKKGKWWQSCFVASVLTSEILFLFLQRGNSLDPDLGWRLRIGQEFSKSHRIIRDFIGYNYEIFSQTRGQFVDHQWLSNFFVYNLYNKYSYVSLWLLALLVMVATIVIILMLTKGYKNSARIISITLFLSSFSLTFIGFRVQYLLYLAAALILLIDARVKSSKLKVIFYCILFMLGSNLHGGGFVVLIPLVLILESAEAFKRQPFKMWARIFLRSLSILVLILCSMTINPYGLSFWRVMGDYLVDPLYRRQILEWLPLYTSPSSLTALVVWSMLVLFVAIGRKRIPIKYLIVIGVFLLSALLSRRSLPLAVLGSVPCVTQALDAEFSRWRGVVGIGAVIFSVILFIVFYSFDLGFQKIMAPARNPFNSEEFYPRAALDWIEKDGRSLNLVNEYVWGGYIVWKYPKFHVLIDGRAPQQPLGQNKTLLSEYNTEIDRLRAGNSLSQGYYIRQNANQPCSKLDLLVFHAGCVIAVANIVKEQEEFKMSPNLKYLYGDDKAIVFRMTGKQN